MGWLAGWSYCKSHVIESAVDAGTNYQIKIIVHYGSDGDSGEDVYCNSHCETDFGDIRFTDDDGTTELDYWMEEKTDSDNAVFWVEVADDLSSVNRTIYVYYGKSGETTTSNGDNTFLFFDDFTSLDLGVWSDPSSGAYHGWLIEDGNLVLYVGTRGKSTGWNIACLTKSLSTYDLEKKIYEIRTKMKMGGTIYDPNNFRTKSSGIGLNIYTSGDAETRLYGRHEGVNHWLRLSKVDGASSAVLWSITPWGGTQTAYYILGLRRNGNELKLYEDYVLQETYADSLTSGNISLGLITHVAWYNANGWGEQSIDWARIRKLVIPEPSHGSWGSEETPAKTKPTSVVPLMRGMGLID